MGSKITLAEICTDISYGYTASATAKPVGPKFLRITDIQGGKVNWENVPYCEIDEKDSLKYLLQDGDIVIARTGNSTGENFIFSSNTKVVFASYLIRFRIDPKKANPKFIWLQMRTPQWWSFIDSVKTGSAQAGANAKVLGLYEVELPERKIQDHIADIGFNLLKKQDINSKINQTLEQMSQTLFKSWFVDFDPVIDNALDAGNPIPEALQTRTKLRQKARNSVDFKPLSAEIRSLFPSEFEETEVGYLPAKWIYSGLSKLIDIKHGFAFKGEYFSETKTNQILLTPGNVRIGGGFKFDKLKYYKGEIPKDYIFGVDDIFVSMTDLSKECDSLGYAARVPSREDTKFLHNQRLGRVILGKHPSSVKEFIYQVLISKNYRNTVLGSVTGTTVKHTSPSKILSHVISHSENGEVERKFDSICSNISLAISRNNENNRILLKIRDTLLPKLISGELSLDDLPDLTTDTEAT
ncbi:hypothetical protein GU325_002020 [Escherichia coli]|nr:hypothetical protein [Escherichia coli]ELP4703820.1 restriction endonuclease subunit S [Escherichia coli]